MRKGQIHNGGNTKDSSLCHTACIPGYQWRSDCNRIFRRAAQQFAFITVCTIDVFKHITRQDNGYILICCSKIQEQARCNCGRHHSYPLFRKTYKYRSDTAEHSSGCHRPSETHGADNQPDGIHHTRHSASGYQFVYFRITGFQWVPP